MPEKARIQELIAAFRHHGIGEEEVYEEIARRLEEDHAFNRSFHDALGQGPLDEATADALRRFYEAVYEGTTLPDEEDEIA